MLTVLVFFPSSIWHSTAGCALELPDAVVGGPHQDEGSHGGQQSQRAEFMNSGKGKSWEATFFAL